MNRRRLGDFGERMAIALLESKGYLIRETNFRTRYGEIDIIAEKDESLVFVEVRAKRGDAMGSAAESIDRRKRKRLVMLAQLYCQQQSPLPSTWRLDVISVDLTKDGKLSEIRHITNAIEDES